jgi:hypothetical protein
MSEFTRQKALALAKKKGINTERFSNVVCFSDGTIFCNTTDKAVAAFVKEHKVSEHWLKGTPEEKPAKN